VQEGYETVETVIQLSDDDIEELELIMVVRKAILKEKAARQEAAEAPSEEGEQVDTAGRRANVGGAEAAQCRDRMLQVIREDRVSNVSQFEAHQARSPWGCVSEAAAGQRVHVAGAKFVDSHPHSLMTYVVGTLPAPVMTQLRSQLTLIHTSG
jgi:hypothetical protein